MNRQSILIVVTERPSLRAEAVGWSCDSGHLVRPGYIGLSPSPQRYTYECVMKALAAGWRLMAPPTRDEDGTWEWWLERWGELDDVPEAQNIRPGIAAAIEGPPDVWAVE